MEGYKIIEKYIEYINLLENENFRRLVIYHEDGWGHDFVDWDSKTNTWRYYYNNLMGREWEDTGIASGYSSEIAKLWLLSEEEVIKYVDDIDRTSPSQLEEILRKKAKENPKEILNRLKKSPLSKIKYFENILRDIETSDQSLDLDII